MKHTTLVAAALLITGAPVLAAPAAPPAPAVVSTGKEATLLKHLEPERPTLFVFLKPNSSLERSFLEELRRDAGERVGLRVIQLRTGDEPIARQYEVRETPTAIVYDRRGRLTGRSSSADEIRKALRKAAGVQRIDWVEEGDPRAEQVRRMGRWPPPEILRTMSFRPDYMAHIAQLSGIAHFSDGFLDRRTKELIATYVSALNKCKY